MAQYYFLPCSQLCRCSAIVLPRALLLLADGMMRRDACSRYSPSDATRCPHQPSWLVWVTMIAPVVTNVYNALSRDDRRSRLPMCVGSAPTATIINRPLRPWPSDHVSHTSTPFHRDSFSAPLSWSSKTACPSSTLYRATERNRLCILGNGHRCPLMD